MSLTEIQRRRQLRLALRKTDIGKAFLKFENATIDYWRLDADGHVSSISLRAADERLKAARELLMPHIYAAAGINPEDF